MKKIIILGSIMLMLGASSFACGGHGRYGGNGRHMGYRSSNPKYQEASIRIQDKNLEIRKETIKSNPDWKKIERLNREILNERATMRTERQKEYRY